MTDYAAATADAGVVQRLARMRAWLRQHGDYRVTINPWGPYGCWVVTMTGPGIEGTASTMGDTLSKRLDNVERWMRELDE